ncbi:UDP-N-acetylmuramoyl-L-alanine--D-glutamate ligase, partial [Sulfurimonas sp.]
MKNKKNISIFGYGVTTKPLVKHIPNAVIYDDKCLRCFTDENGITVKPSREFNPKKSDLEITSPGIPPYNGLIQKANNLISEYDFFAKTSPLKVWISGTNGKTTTTQMMQHLLKDKGSLAGGNIGTPLAQLDQKAKIWLLETSSFTMHYTNIAKPNIYVLLPLSPDHLSWHGSMKEYEESKLKPLAMMNKNDIAIIPKKYENRPTKAKVITYQDEFDLAKYFKFDKTKIKFKGAFLADALLAMAVEKLLFQTISYEKINSFELDPHRQEELHDSKNRLWVNDTKATNLDATIAALKRYKGSFIHLILGGDDKGVDLNELFEFLAPLSLKIYAIGSNKEKLTELSLKYNIKHKECRNLLNAVNEIDKDLKADEVGLLSPAAASLDEFDSYAQRGDQFK